MVALLISLVLAMPASGAGTATFTATPSVTPTVTPRFPMGDKVPTVLCSTHSAPCVVSWQWNLDGTMTISATHHGVTVTNSLSAASLGFLRTGSRALVISTNFSSGTLTASTP